MSSGGDKKKRMERQPQPPPRRRTMVYAPRQQRLGWLVTLNAVWKEGGMSALFAGWAPRAARAAPACAIVLSTYEAIKAYLTGEI